MPVLHFTSIGLWPSCRLLESFIRPHLRKLFRSHNTFPPCFLSLIPFIPISCATEDSLSSHNSFIHPAGFPRGAQNTIYFVLKYFCLQRTKYFTIFPLQQDFPLVKGRFLVGSSAPEPRGAEELQGGVCVPWAAPGVRGQREQILPPLPLCLSWENKPGKRSSGADKSNQSVCGKEDTQASGMCPKEQGGRKDGGSSEQFIPRHQFLRVG